MEIQRKSNIVPFGVQHTVSENVVFHGYFIPKNAIVLPLMESVLSDEKIWEDPEVFRPERFLDENGKCARPDEFIPFSLGEFCVFTVAYLRLLIGISNRFVHKRNEISNKGNIYFVLMQKCSYVCKL